MAHPTVAEFRQILSNSPLEQVVQDHVLGGDPFAFVNRPRDLILLKKHLSDHLGVPLADIEIVGSAKIGFSLAPHKFGQAFSPRSDVDVLIVNSQIFDSLWMNLLKWQYPRRLLQLPNPDRQWAAERQGNIYWGWFRPDQIKFRGLAFPESLKPVRDIGARWFNAFQSLSRNPTLASRDYSGRLYRTWEHARAYQEDGLRQILQNLEQLEA